MREMKKKRIHKKTSVMIVRCTPEEKEELLLRMEASNLTISDYIRMLITLDKKEGYICKY